MNILLVTALVAGGVGRHVEQLARGLRQHPDGHRVVVACPAAVAEHFDLGEPVIDLPVGQRPHPVRDRRAVASLRSALRGADVVHAHGLRAGALCVLARGPRGSDGPRLVVTTHNGPPEGRAARGVYAVMEQLVARGADLVLGVSPDLLERAGRAGAQATGLAVVPADTALAGLDPEATRMRVRHELGLGEGPSPRLIVNVGRLARQKGQGALVEAYLQLVRDWPGRRRPVLVIAGEGPERPVLESQVATSSEDADVRLLGHRSDVPDLLAAADLVVSSAVWEGQPVWLQEALQQGAAIVATDVGGTGVLLGEGAALVEPGPGVADRLSREMTHALVDETRNADLRARAEVRAGQLPTEADAVAAALEAYRDDLGEPGAPTPAPVT